MGFVEGVGSGEVGLEGGGVLVAPEGGGEQEGRDAVEILRPSFTGKLSPNEVQNSLKVRAVEKWQPLNATYLDCTVPSLR